MKKTFFFLTTLFLVLGSRNEAYVFNDFYYTDANNMYSELFIGANILQTNPKDYETGYDISFALGYRCPYGFRFEGEYAYRRNELEEKHFHHCKGSGFFQSSSYMANFLWDMPLTSWGLDFCSIFPFGGAGVGYDFQQVHTKHKNHLARSNTISEHFSWQVIAGLSYPITYTANITLEYKYHKGGLDNIYNHSVGIGLLCKFAPDYLNYTRPPF